jgi:hypothetical protein
LDHIRRQLKPAPTPEARMAALRAMTAVPRGAKLTELLRGLVRPGADLTDIITAMTRTWHLPEVR